MNTQWHMRLNHAGSSWPKCVQSARTQQVYPFSMHASANINAHGPSENHWIVESPRQKSFHGRSSNLQQGEQTLSFARKTYIDYMKAQMQTLWIHNSKQFGLGFHNESPNANLVGSTILNNTDCVSTMKAQMQPLWVHNSDQSRLWVHNSATSRIVAPQLFVENLQTGLWGHKKKIKKVVDPQP